MGLLDILERMFMPSRKAERIDLKEITGKPRGEPIHTVRTAVVGCTYSNPDGSDRQETLEKLKPGQRVRLILDAGKNVVYLLRHRHTGTHQLAMPDCFGRLEDKVAANVIRWMNQDNVVTLGKIVKITGGTRKRPKLGCVLELNAYPGPKKK